MASLSLLGSQVSFRREPKFDPCEKIQVQRREAERLLILLVQKIVQPAVELPSPGKLIGEPAVCQDVAFVAEESSGGAEVRLHVQHGAAHIAVQVEHQP